MAQAIDNKNDALKFAMKLIGLRRRSEAEVRKRLKDKGCAGELINETVTELYHYKYMDDTAFAESYIHDRINFHPSGRFVIKNELKKSGIAPAIIEEKLDELLNEKKELELAERLVDKKLRTTSLEDKKKLRARIVYHLQSRGFSSKIISQALENKIELDKFIDLEND